MSFDYDVVVNLVKNSQSKVKAFANLIVEDTLEVCGFKVINGSKGLFVAAPNSRSSKTDEQGNPIYYDDVRFLDQKKSEDDWRTPFQEEVYQLIMTRYNEEVGKSSRGSAAGAQAQDGGTTGARPSTPDNPMEDQKLW